MTAEATTRRVGMMRIESVDVSTMENQEVRGARMAYNKIGHAVFIKVTRCQNRRT